MSRSICELTTVCYIDTGTSLLLLPDSVVDDYYAEFPGAVNDPSKGGFIFPCSSTPPNFTFGVDAHRAVIPGRFMSFGPADGNGSGFIPPETRERKHC